MEDQIQSEQEASEREHYPAGNTTYQSNEVAPHGEEGLEWKKEFPYRQDEDELVTRRDILRFMIAGSGALFIATGFVSYAGNLLGNEKVKPVPIAKVGELKENEFRVFDFPDKYGQGILINLPGKGLVAYSDVCTHLSCAVLYRKEQQHLHCPCHEGLFDATTGNVLAGPPTRPLPLIQLAIQNDTIYAVRMVLR